MSSLTEKKKREIEMLYRKMKEKPSKVFLSIFLDESILNEPALHTYISQLMKRMRIESYTHSEGTNHLTATAQWTESDAQYKVEDLRNTRGIKYVQAKILYPARD
jgi:uncharacterized membrane-anchored protein